MKEKYDIGLLGWWYGENYGSMLTYYALNRTLEKLGYSVLMIHENLGYNGWRVKWSEDIDPLEFARRVGYTYTEQIDYTEASSLNEKCRSFMVGSDQLWNPLIGRVNDDLFLDFVNADLPRFSYGTSFGNRDTQKFSPNFIERHTEDLKKFSAISVREEYAVDIARDVFQVHADQVVDPVFLLSTQEYADLAMNASFKTEGDYLLAFILDPNEEKRHTIDAIAKKLSLSKIYVLANPEDRDSAEAIFFDQKYQIVEENKPENWLYAYQNATYVVTDSFHGSCFSYIFKKPFSSFYNQTRGADRFVNLMELFGLGETRRIYEGDGDEKILANPNVSQLIDFSQAIENIDNFAKKSETWLQKNLEIYLGESLDESDLSIRIQELEKENLILKQTIAILSKPYSNHGGNENE